MRRFGFVVALALLCAAPLSAQQKLAYEAGIFAQYTKYDSFTGINDGVGLGGRFDFYFLKEPVDRV